MASIFKPAGKSKYVIVYLDEDGRRRKKVGAPDKQVSERIAADVENRVALRRAGLVDPKAESYRDHDARPLFDHLDAYAAHLANKRRTRAHIALTLARTRRVVALCRGAALGDIEPANSGPQESGRAAVALARWIAPARLSHLATEPV
jgi:hypothetical protein